MFLPIVFLSCFLLGSITGSPQDEFRSNLEFEEYGTNLDEPKYRLRNVVQPRNMYVDLDVYLDEARFNGFVQIDVEVTESNLEQIVFHQKVVSILAVNVLDSNNAAVPLKVPDPYTTDDYYELLVINLANPIPAGNYTIAVRYLGQINLNPIDRGFYRGYYYLNNQLRLYATTQFQPYHARKAFPCFDEPQFKSRFMISITRDANLGESFSNMAISSNSTENGRTREVFYPTPIISAYLVAFHVSDFVATQYTSTDARPFQIISRQGVNNQHPYAADIGLKITNALDDYFGIQYHEMGQGTLMKNDHIALPDFPSGAMENWGMVNYREAYLLYDAAHTNLNSKVFIATIMAHELGHKWFGNLVTCFWWSNLWLNESYASFLEYFAAHWADPSLELDDQFVVDYVHSALNSDASPSATPMNHTAVVDNLSVSSHFSVTSYAKGASVLRMMEHFVGFRNFRNGLRYYLRDNAYEIGTPEKMYDALRLAVSEDFSFAQDFENIDVGEVFDSWVQNRGAPVLNVNVNMDTGVISVSQERYVISGETPEQLWHIPLTWTTRNNIDFTNTKPRRILSSRSINIEGTPGHNWVIFNIAQSGLYRVNYDDHNWEMLASYLKSNNRQNIHKLNRAQIVNDILYFVRSGSLNRTLAFDVLDFLRSETDYYVWKGALGQLDWIRSRLEHLPAAHTAFSNYVLELMDAAIRHLGFEERATDSTSTILNRMQIMNYACNLGHAGCVSDSLNKWRQFRQNDSQLVPVNARRYVYCTGLREGNATDYSFLYNIYNTSQNTADMVVILRTLACTKDEASIKHYLTQSMYNDRIRIHDRTNAWSYALQGNRENQAHILNFLYENFEEMRTTYGGEVRLATCISAIPAFLTDFAVITQFQTWVYANQVALGGLFSNGVSAVNTAINNLNWGNSAAPEIYNFLLARSASNTFVASSVLLLVAMVLQMFR